MHSILRLDDFNVKMIQEICDSLTKAYNPLVSKFFIYQEKNFKDFFEAKIQKPNVYVFYSIDYALNKLSGFVFFEIVNNNLYLRNILIDHSFIDQGLGGNLFINAVKTIYEDYPGLEILQVDTFERNNAAINWYSNLGMVINSYLFWYDITDLFKSLRLKKSRTQDTISLRSDEFGFQHLIHNKVEIGDLINNQYLIIKIDPTPAIFSDIQIFFNSNPPLAVCLVSSQKLDLKLLETSVHFAIGLNNLDLKNY